MSNIVRAKACWVAEETRKGWRVTFWHGNTSFPVRGLVLATKEDVKKILFLYNKNKEKK